LIRHSSKTPQERMSARYLVLAAGAWNSQVPFSVGGIPASILESFPVKGHLAGYQLPPGSLNPILRRGHHYIVQRKNGFTIACSCEEYGDFDRSTSPERIREIRNAAGLFYSPISKQEPVCQWIGFRPRHRAAPARHRKGTRNNRLAGLWAFSKWHSPDSCNRPSCFQRDSGQPEGQPICPAS
jgi:glycine/D-amino acid oxidase-like deaminating enzyme